MKALVVNAMTLGIWSISLAGFTGLFTQPERKGDSIDLKDCPALFKPFKVAPYVLAAAKLQELGKEKACKQLTKLQRSDEGRRVAILCRMLFCKKGTASFRAPRFGSPT